MERTIYNSETILRSFDLAWCLKDALAALGYVETDLAGATTTVLGGFAAAPTAPASLTINLARGRIYQNAVIDGSPFSSLASDSTLVQQQGIADAQAIALTTAALTSGHSQWVLIQAQFSQADQVRVGDPTSGVEQYFNTNNPTQPFQGPDNNGLPGPTVRRGLVTLQAVYGTPATTGSEVPPNPSAGWVPLYLIDLAFGQTTIVSNQILVAGPSVGSNVPSNYPGAPFIAGLLNAHHSGGAGQAPKVNLTNAAEVQGVLPGLNLVGQLSQCYLTPTSDVSIRLIPQNGNLIRIAGRNYEIPIAGATSGNTNTFVGGVAAQNLAPSVIYNVFAFNNAGTLALDFWANSGAGGHMPDTTAGNVGVEVQAVTGTPVSSRTYVGKVVTDGAGKFYPAQGRGVISWFNRKAIALYGSRLSGLTTASASNVELSTGLRTFFLTFGDETFDFTATSLVSNSVNSARTRIVVVDDTGGTGFEGQVATQIGEQYSVSSNSAGTLTEGQHYVAGFGAVTTGTGTFDALVAVKLRG